MRGRLCSWRWEPPAPIDGLMGRTPQSGTVPTTATATIPTCVPGQHVAHAHAPAPVRLAAGRHLLHDHCAEQACRAAPVERARLPERVPHCAAGPWRSPGPPGAFCANTTPTGLRRVTSTSGTASAAVSWPTAALALTLWAALELASSVWRGATNAVHLMEHREEARCCWLHDDVERTFIFVSFRVAKFCARSSILDSPPSWRSCADPGREIRLALHQPCTCCMLDPAAAPVPLPVSTRQPAHQRARRPGVPSNALPPRDATPRSCCPEQPVRCAHRLLPWLHDSSSWIFATRELENGFRTAHYSHTAHARISIARDALNPFAPRTQGGAVNSAVHLDSSAQLHRCDDATQQHQ